MNVSRSCYRLRPTALSTRAAPTCRSFTLSARRPAGRSRFVENRITSYKNALHDRLETVRKHKATLKPGANLDDSGENARLVQGSLADNSLLNDDIAQNTDVGSSTTLYGHEIPLSRLQAIDPQPFKRRRYERTMVIRDVKRRGRISREVHLRRTERESQTKSPFIRTSIKKLSPIANQIMGKTVEEAITQMRLSKKRVAEVIAEQLELARDTAMATRGMGLGKIQGTAGERVTIRLKDGTPKTIYDRTTLYVARTWINRGPYGMDVNRRARGRRDLLRLPQTYINIVLKEQATLIRQHEEREARAALKKPWIQMPDKPIGAQRQYYTW